MADTRCRKWNITINNPLDYSYDHDKICEIINSFSDYKYACLCDEIGEQGTYHTHLYIQFDNARKFSTMKNKFDIAHIEMAKGSAQQNRDYIRKEGKYLDSEKHETNLIDTFKEFGILPLEEQGFRTDLKVLKEMVEDGCSNKEIIDFNANYINQLDNIDKIRIACLEDKYANEIRNVDVTYIYGDSGSGKTTYVANKYGYKNIFRITDYSHPFDSYKGQDVIVFEEFRSDLPISSMLIYLDIHPCELPCRYNNKFACYTKIYLISNISFFEQYAHEQRNEKETFKAFNRRIHHFMEFINGEKRYYDNYFDFKCNCYKLITDDELK